MMAYCDGCFYQKHFNGSGPYCDYLCMVGKRRPCPPGEGCTARIETRRVGHTGIEFGGRSRTDLSGMTQEEKAEWHKARKREYYRMRYANRTEADKERERIAKQKYYQKKKAERNEKHKLYYEIHKDELNAKRRERNRKKREMKENG